MERFNEDNFDIEEERRIFYVALNLQLLINYLTIESRT